ncbi:saccharopine dehydrogenase family protein [Nocardia neocaledoniensis]|uniref:saccharopine dehydrogenase family protein n=1 Tax=Nocardia neocaledoniensis TaxID=236511 RepID=UPI002455C65B|nr:saccharopine dehydrogenase NADP-binding domain-containing protein [Nocardia neocaledoniensis]
MRVLALGGAGEMGRVAARVLRGDSGVSALTIADRDAAAARRVAAELGVDACGLDVTDGPALTRALREADLVVNTVGPYFRFGPPVLAAAIDAGCDYIDICDDPQPTIDMLELDARAKAAGVTALLGMGASPGVANLLAVRAGTELDRVDSLITGWNIHSAHTEDSVGPTAAVVHGMRQISGSIPVTRGGVRTERPALERFRLDYPGLGAGAGRSFGHPEAITLPLAFSGLRAATSVVVADRPTTAALRALRWSIDRRLLSLDRAARLAARVERLLPADPATLVAAGGLPPLFALATGTRDGAPATAATALCQVPGLSMAENTGVPLAVGALLMAADPKPGVHAPETLLDPDAFFTAFAPHCIGGPDPDAMTITTSSWSSAETNTAALSSALLTALIAAR